MWKFRSGFARRSLKIVGRGLLYRYNNNANFYFPIHNSNIKHNATESSYGQPTLFIVPSAEQGSSSTVQSFFRNIKHTIQIWHFNNIWSLTSFFKFLFWNSLKSEMSPRVVSLLLKWTHIDVMTFKLFVKFRFYIFIFGLFLCFCLFLFVRDDTCTALVSWQTVNSNMSMVDFFLDGDRCRVEVKWTVRKFALQTKVADQRKLHCFCPVGDRDLLLECLGLHRAVFCIFPTWTKSCSCSTLVYLIG